MNINKLLVVLSLFFGQQIVVSADTLTEIEPTISNSKAWEFGLGGSIINWDRVTFSNFSEVDGNYKYHMNIDQLFGGVNLYVARELTPWFFLDMQGTIGMAKNHASNGGKYDYFYMLGPGIQFRFTPLFKAKFLEPYVRVGLNYAYHDFDATSIGYFDGDPTGQASWESSNDWNTNGYSNTDNNLVCASFGAGLQGWINDKWGLGLQAEYLMSFKSNQPKFAETTLRVMYRLGGKSKLPSAVVRYVDRPVDRYVDRIVEKEVKVPVVQDSLVYKFIESVLFDFNKDQLTSESEITLDKLANMIKICSNDHFLITGYTDAKGSYSYNNKLSRRRAEVVYNALIDRGVDKSLIKWRGVGMRATTVPASGSNDIRQVDRKVQIEKVSNVDFWNWLNNGK